MFTSNVDGQFQQAGYAEDQVHECQGSIHSVQCLRPCTGDIWPAGRLMPSFDTETCRWPGDLPSCPLCGGLLRPNILMFGDGGWLEWRADQQRALLDAWLGKVRQPVVVELGAGTHIPSVRHFGNEVVRDHGGRLIRINPREADVPSRLDWVSQSVHWPVWRRSTRRWGHDLDRKGCAAYSPTRTAFGPYWLSSICVQSSWSTNCQA